MRCVRATGEAGRLRILELLPQAAHHNSPSQWRALSYTGNPKNGRDAFIAPVLCDERHTKERDVISRRSGELRMTSNLDPLEGPRRRLQ